MKFGVTAEFNVIAKIPEPLRYSNACTPVHEKPQLLSGNAFANMSR